MDKDLIEIRWHSRAGQGAITASNAIADILGMDENVYVQSFSEYGAEKRGASVAVFTRIGKEKIDFLNQIEVADYVILLDTTLINPSELSEDAVLGGLKQDGVMLVNSDSKETNFKGKVNGDIWHIDATKIATEEIGKNIPNVVMVAAFLKISGIYPLDKFAEGLKNSLKKLPEKIIEGNMRAFKRGADEVFKITK